MTESHPPPPRAPSIRPPTVLHLRSSGGLYGADRVVLDLCRELPGSGYHPLLVPLIEPGGVGSELREAALAAGVRVRPLILRHRFDWGGVARLQRLALIEGADIVHGHDYKTNLLIQLAAPPDARRVATLHGRVGTDRKLRLYEALESRVVRGFDRVICVSEPMRAAEAAHGLEPVVIPNGIDLTRFRAGAGAEGAALGLRESLGLPADAEVVGSIGRLSPEKGFDVLVRAVSHLVPQRPRLHLLLIGDGQEGDHLRRLALSLGLGDRLHLPGRRGDAPLLYPLFDVFCLPSHREGTPLVLLEAMAAERPVVATPVGGIPEVLGEPGAAGLLVPPGDARGWARTISRLLEDQERSARMGALARRRVAENYSLTRMALAVAHLYDGLLGRSDHREPADPRR